MREEKLQEIKLPEPHRKEALLKFENVSKVYDKIIPSLRNVSLEITKGEFVFIVGKTGSGKSTFLKLITKELDATSGKILFEGQDLCQMKHHEIPYLRRQIGVIRQGAGMFLEDRSAAENLEFVMRATGHPEKDLHPRAIKALAMVGLGEKTHFLPSELSIGEKKRVEIARALVNNPKLIIADEPTASLDRDLSWDIMSLFQDINELGVTLVIVSHDKEIVNIMRKRVITFANGKVLGDVKKARYGDLV